MEKLAVNFRNNGEQEVASAFNKFAEFSKELLTPMKNLVSHLIENTPSVQCCASFDVSYGVK